MSLKRPTQSEVRNALKVLIAFGELGARRDPLVTKAPASAPAEAKSSQ